MDSIQSETTHMSIYLSSFVTDNSHFNDVREKFTQNIQKDLAKIIELYPTRISNEDRVQLFQDYFEWIPIPQHFLERLQKNTESSTHFREVGNNDYSKGQIPSALRSYNLALCFAPPNSKEQMLAYSNRSALLAKIKEYKSALQDILRVEASEVQLDEKISKKLTERRQTCESSLAKEGLNSLIRNKEWEQGVEYCKSKLALKNPNSLLLGAEGCVKMEYDRTSGRKLVATEDIPAGKMLLKDEPYCFVLDGLLTWDMEHCTTCIKPILAGIPDLESTFSLYCNEGCRSKSKTLPNPLLTYLHLCSHLRNTLLPLTVLFNSPESSSYQNQSPDTEHPGLNSVYDPSKYSAVHDLIQHRQQFDFPSITTIHPTEFTAIFLSHLVSSLCQTQNKLSPALLLRHLENLPYSQITLSSWESDRIGNLSIPFFSTLAKQSNASLSTKAYSSVVFNLIALVNNSCDPNAIFFKNCRTLPAFLISSKRIRKGDEIFMSYRGHWSGVGVTERKKYLQENYCFECNCSACRESLGPESVLGCESITGGEEDEDFLIEVEEELDEGVELINKEKYAEALEVIIACCNRLNRFDGRFQLCVVAQTLLRRVILHLSML